MGASPVAGRANSSAPIGRAYEAGQSGHLDSTYRDGQPVAATRTDNRNCAEATEATQKARSSARAVRTDTIVKSDARTERRTAPKNTARRNTGVQRTITDSSDCQ